VIKLLVADDHPLVRQGLRRVVADSPDIVVVGEAATADEMLVQVDRLGPDLVVLDVSMPGPGLLEALRTLRARHPAVRTLVLSVHPEEQYAVRALKAGAAGYLTKDQAPLELLAAIRRVYRGGRYVSEALGEKLALGLGPDTATAPHEQLSDREFEVLRLLGAGSSVSDIARRLSLSPKTVSTYRTRILAKLRVKSTAELIRYAVEHDLVGSPAPTV
jgi:DNA-binding NarL/FixJ family response regulator